MAKPADTVKEHCIKENNEFLNYLDNKGRIQVKVLRQNPNLNHLYRIYDRVSVSICRQNKYKNNNKNKRKGSLSLGFEHQLETKGEDDLHLAVVALVALANASCT